MPREIEPLVSCHWLKTEIEKGLPKNVVVCDVSWSSTRDMQEEYFKRHIPGAIFVNVFDESEFTEMYPRNIPKLEKFQENVRKVGINNGDHLILYSNSDMNGFFGSGRAFWVFKIFGHKNLSILNGGLSKWIDEGYPTTDEVPPRQLAIHIGDFKASFDAEVVATFEDVEAIAKSQSVQICDSRGASKFSGEDSSGHIKNAKNVPLPSLMSDDGVLKSEADAKEEFKKAGIDLAKPLLTYCNSGMSSCSLAYIALLYGCPKCRVYMGGFTEWSKRSSGQLTESN